jgi:hypothetical protein
MYEVRRRAALSEARQTAARQVVNGDEERYSNRIANYTKGLPHSAQGEVDTESYDALLRALTSGKNADFDRIPIGGAAKLANPQAAFAFDLEGPDARQLAIAVPPRFDSAQQAAEMVELYWHAITRDIPFADYGTNELTKAASGDLTRCQGFGGPSASGYVGPQTLFRGFTAGDLEGPYISQFLVHDVPYGAIPLVQRIRTTPAGDDYGVREEEWLAIQRGLGRSSPRFARTPRYIANGRDLAMYVRNDPLYQAFLNAALILLKMGVPFDNADPYRFSRNQSGFVTFGPAAIVDLVARVANCALKAAWYQKWLVHRRLRPEEFAGCVHRRLTTNREYPIAESLLRSKVLERLYARTGTYLLPLAYPEGCPLHPSYPAGHAVVAGACATVLKAVFDENFIISQPFAAARDGSVRTPIEIPLTIRGELDKLASNIAVGRNIAGLHWRSDYCEGLRLGEAVAIGIMRDMKECLHERISGYSLTTFDGARLTI